MTLSHHDHDLAAASSTESSQAPRGARVPLWAWAAVALIVVVAGGLALAALLGDAEEATIAAETDTLPEYGVDTPVVLYAPPAPAHFVGADANLDPDVPPWYTIEYDRDTARVAYAIPETIGFVGGDANLDPDGPAQWQSEYDVDSALVVTTGPRRTYFVGGDANLDPNP